MGRTRESSRAGRPGVGWFTTQEMVEIFGRSDAFFRRDIQVLADGEDEVRHINGTNWFFSPTLLTKWKGKRTFAGGNGGGTKRVSAEDSADDDDDNLTEEQQHHKTRKIRAEADMMELKLAVEQEKLVLVDVIRPYLSQYASLAREYGEKNQRKFGPEAYEGAEEFVENVKALNDKLLPSNRHPEENNEAGT